MVKSQSSQFDIASSPQGNVKISLICNSSQQSGFRIPSLDAVLKLVEEKYIITYRITEPGFSVVKVMKDVYECFLAEGTNCTDDGQEIENEKLIGTGLQKQQTLQSIQKVKNKTEAEEQS
ncbi:putative inactive histone-lysine N-methyltransferase SUVR2 [Camellia lanceoleosa]|uniref:Inactive histone-lysine N-methyltransferase SUVR2 n=1 Tax=Camellia lanceoleosa TaxID=1840588 RepID=A0ACC0F7B8_9ERIC|nr:putative inactive histone-lysine N-methyltransferase SUVR2 [Camellia lanceoleosa]